MADTDERAEQRRQELLKLHFEYFKHLTTISAAATVVLLAVYREGVAERQVLASSLVVLGIAAFISLLGMLAVVARFKANREAGWVLSILLDLSFALFGLGLVGFITEATNFPLWPRIVALIVLVLFLAYGFNRRRTDKSWRLP